MSSKQAATFVLQDGDHVLMEYRTDGVFAPGTWIFPGGKIEDGESPITAFIREAEEELGVEVLAYRPLPPLEHRGWMVHPFQVLSHTGTLPERTDAGDELRWIPLEDVVELWTDWPPAVQIAEQILRNPTATMMPTV